MTELDNHDKVLTLEGRVERIYEWMKAFAEGELPPCTRHDERIKSLVDGQNRQWALLAAIALTTIGAAVKAVWF